MQARDLSHLGQMAVWVAQAPVALGEALRLPTAYYRVWEYRFAG